MKTVLAIIGLLLLLVGIVYLEVLFVVWVLGLFAVVVTHLQAFGIVAGLYFLAGFFKVKNSKK